MKSCELTCALEQAMTYSLGSAKNKDLYRFPFGFVGEFAFTDSEGSPIRSYHLSYGELTIDEIFKEMMHKSHKHVAEGNSNSPSLYQCINLLLSFIL